MEKRSKATQIYGYAICLVAVITFIICLAALVSAVFNLTDPIKSRSLYNREKSPSLASFENYKMDLTLALKEGQQLPDDPTLERMFEAAKTDIMQSVQFQARRDISVDIIIILVAILLFFTHWRWMRRLIRAEAD
ncbi:hypothetical protein KJ564_09745 [bacterium]|nr:hypothetical protein [bacterium]